MASAVSSVAGTAPLAQVIERFTAWLERYGETSFDHQSYFAGAVGGGAKALYYRRPKLGMFAVAPIIASEAFVPALRRLFWHKQRFPIADAHYAMGFAALARFDGVGGKNYQRAVHFLEVLEQTRCPGYERHAWGYPFDWVTRNGVMKAQTPLITSTAYMYEAFDAVYQIDRQRRWLDVMRSIADHALLDFPDKALGPDAACVGYNPHDKQAEVVNASAYRAFLLFSAARRFGRDDYHRAAERNLAYVLDAQSSNGSWRYATDGVRDFVDHFHTCFVLKSLAKIEAQGSVAMPRLRGAIEAGVRYYVHNLFDETGLPRPFAKAPRLTVYRHELYDYAECINLCTLLHGRFAELDARLQTTLDDLMGRWIKRDGSFRARRLLLGWDNVPMHRWAQSQMFRSMALLLCSGAGAHREEAVARPAVAARSASALSATAH